MKNLVGIVLCLASISFLGAQEGTMGTAASPSGTPLGSFRQEGIASWYGAEFEGRPTASGEIFNARNMTAAHPTLPFGTVLRVTNIHNGKVVVVRVNDRGPFVAARIIDVSRAAAEQLDMIITGTAPVLVEAVDGGVSVAAVPNPAAMVPRTLSPSLGGVPPAAGIAQPTQVAAPTRIAAAPAPTASAAVIRPSLPDPDSGKRFRIQVGSFKDARHARDAFSRLGAAGFKPAYERFGEYYRVVLAGVGAQEIGNMAERLGAAGFTEVLIREER